MTETQPLQKMLNLIKQHKLRDAYDAALQLDALDISKQAQVEILAEICSRLNHARTSWCENCSQLAVATLDHLRQLPKAAEHHSTGQATLYVSKECVDLVKALDKALRAGQIRFDTPPTPPQGPQGSSAGFHVEPPAPWPRG